jgi:hypothetical protein
MCKLFCACGATISIAVVTMAAMVTTAIEKLRTAAGAEESSEERRKLIVLTSLSWY